MNFISRIIIAVLLLLPAYSLAAPGMPLNDLTVRFDLERHAIAGVSKISLPAGQTVRVNLTGLKLTAVSINDRARVVEPGAASLTFTPGTAEDILKIEYEAEYPNVPDSDAAKKTAVISGNAISSEGILLMENWHPSVEGTALYRLKAILPAEFEGISEANEVQVTGRSDGSREFYFDFAHPLRNLTLIAGRYQVEKERHGEVDVCTYFFAEDSELSKTYREYTKKYLDMYEKYIGKYPFKRFAVVENFLPTGYALPTFTLLGKDIVRLPFIVETSLGHEILHQWFGNLVYTDEKSGNWSEGLTTYLADHMYEEMKEKGWDYRKQIMVSFRSYVTAGKDFPLSSFTGRTDRASAAIGYGKSAMVFHMLRKKVGDENFFSSLRSFIGKNSFKTASWAQIREAFETGNGNNLDWFFKQWIDEPGAPELEIKNLELTYRGARAVISFTAGQKGKSYRLLLPIVLKLRKGEVRKVFEIEKESTSLEIEVDAEEMPVALIIDDNYDIFRKLSDEESPPVISQLLGDDKKIFVVPAEKEGVYAGLSDYLKEEGFAEKKESGLSYEDIRDSSLLIPGKETSLAKRLLGKIEGKKADFYLVARRNPFNKEKVVVVIESSEPSEIEKYMRKASHYGKYSTLTFEGDKNIIKMVDDTERGIMTAIAVDTPGVEIPRITDMHSVIEKVAGKDIIYVGELHDRFEHHRVQLQVIMELYRKYKKIAIGMEMFQKPSQQALDDYIAGTIDEKTLLKKSEYFKRWGFDYNLYREILLFAREYRIPVIALNIRKEIVSKVSKEGLQALTEEEMKEVPEYFDLSDMDYRERLREFFGRHSGSGGRNFDFFYQAQVLWDESMAHNLDDFVRKNPDYKVVVLTGTGHMTFGSGIPKRSFRLNSRDYAVILNAGDIEKDVADFVLFPPPLEMPDSPKLGVLLKEEDKKVIIVQLSPGSIAEKAGLKEDDVIISLDDSILESIDDMRIFLLFKKKGDEITVKASRKRFFFGPEEKEFKITL